MFSFTDQLFFIPLGANAGLTELWRHRVIAMFLDKGLLNPAFARKPLRWSSLRIFNQQRDTNP